jgi:putative ABC transport system permease protein
VVGVLDRKLLREVRSSGSLLIAITSVIAVGVMCFVYMRSAYYNLNYAKDDYYAQCRMADFAIDVKKVPVVELGPISEMPGVVEVRPRIQFFATVDLDRTPAPLNALVLSLPDRRAHSINDVVMMRGSYFSDRRENEVIVNDAFALKHGIHPGQTIHLIMNNRRQELFVVGSAISSEYVYLVGPGSLSPDPEHFGVFYLKRSFAEDVFDFSGACNQVLGLLAPDVRDRPDATLRRLEAMLEPYGVNAVVPLHNQPSNRFLSDEIHSVGTFASILPAIFLVVAAMVLNVLMMRLIEQQRTIVGTLKAVGYHDWQIFSHFAKYGASLGSLGGVLGLVLGNRMAVFVTNLYKTFFEFPNLHNHFYTGTYLLGLLMSLLCALIGSLHGARQALKLKPADAMRPKPPPRGGAVWLERFTEFWRQLGFGWRMVLRNVLRQRFRTLVGVFAAAMGAALLVCGFTLQNGVQFMIKFQFDLISHSDLDLTFVDERSHAALLESARLPGVDYAEPQFDLACTFVNEHHRRKGTITGLDPNARLTIPRDLQGRPLKIPEHGILMTRKLASLLQVRAGDKLTILPTKGAHLPIEIPVADITDSYIGLTVYADLRYLHQLMAEEYALTGVQLSLDQNSANKLALFHELKQLPAIRSVSAKSDTVHNLQTTVVETQKVFIGLIVFFAGVIFLSSLLNMSLINLSERRREVATLRVLGYSELEVGGLFLRETMVVNLLGTLLGLPLGYLLAWWITIIYDTEMFRFPLDTPPSLWIKAVLLGFAFATIAHAIVQWNITKLDWLEASKTRE